MKKPPAVAQAGGESRGLSIVLEGIDTRFISILSVALADELTKSGQRVLLEKNLRSLEEGILLANQYLLDATAAKLSPETTSLMVVIKLRERMATIKNTKKQGVYAIANTSWLGDAYYYELRSRSDISKQIISDCSFMKPDVWVVFDEESGVYSRLAKQVGIKVLSPRLPKTKIISELASMIQLAEENLSTQVGKKIQQPEEIPARKHQASYLAVARKFSSALVGSYTELSTTLDYYRPDNLGKKVLTAYDTILKKILQNYTQAVKDYSKYLATQAIRNKKPFKVEKLMEVSRQLCQSLLPACILIDFEEGQEIEEITDQSSVSSSDVIGLLPNIDSELPTLHVNLSQYIPRNEFEVLEGVLFASTDQSVATIKNLVDELSYEQKAKLLNDSVNQVSSIQNVFYNFEIFCELRQLFDLLKDVGGSVSIQDLTPRNSYDISDKIEIAGLVNLFQQSYDLSLELYSLLQAAGFNSQAQYAVLLGHRVRCKLTLEFHQIKKLQTNKNVGYKTLAKDIKQRVSGVHPLLWRI